jgi:hypothetical protein
MSGCYDFLVIPAGTNATRADARRAAVTLAEQALAASGDPAPGDPGWARCVDQASEVLQACGLAGAP